MKKKILLIIVIVMILFAVALIGVSHYYRNSIAERDRTIESLINQEPEVVEKETIIEKEVEITGVTIRNGLRNCGKLVTAEYYFTHVTTFDSSKEIKGFTIPLTKSSFVYSYDGVIYAGIDFSKIEVEKDDINKIITVTIPKAEIISSEVDPDSFRLYDEKNNIFNPIKVQDVTDSFAELLKDEEAKAVEKGIYDKAAENAKTLIENFILTYNLSGYSIIVNTK